MPPRREVHILDKGALAQEAQHVVIDYIKTKEVLMQEGHDQVPWQGNGHRQRDAPPQPQALRSEFLPRKGQERHHDQPWQGDADHSLRHDRQADADIQQYVPSPATTTKPLPECE
jgi:hypothetical protein